MSKTIQAIRGTRDILPEEGRYWQFVEATTHDVLSRALYQQIRTPIFEQTPLFERGIGEATDVVGKEMYTFTDRGDRSITLRPEGTAGVVRSYIENKLYATGGVQRLWYTGPMFRYERPQAGRQRQFHQIGVEVLGSSDPRADTETISIATTLLKSFGLQNLHLAINSVGDAADRQHYRDALVEYFTPFKNDLDRDSQDRLDRNPLRILDSKDERTQEIAQSAPSILDYLGDRSKQHFDRVCDLLTQLGIDYAINPRLVRGLDYYTHTAFEIQSDDLGAQATVCGGGRYDGLVEQLGGKATPAVGWAIGMERLIILLQKIGCNIQSDIDFFIISKGDQAEAQALAISHRLRNLGFTAELDLSGSAFGKQLRRADRSGAKACLILGDAEAEAATLNLKWLATGDQETIAQADLLEHVEDWRVRLKAEPTPQNTSIAV
ncbi:MAG: histidine--tRNA ligase [Oscillatoriales cyanobacterium]|nr:MAG: histidine--tRNA ligase [Oscillatoriales cyanobacterium]